MIEIDGRRYEVVREVTESQSARVLEAVARGRVERRVAIKQLRPGVVNASATAAFIDEARIISQLSHGAVVPLLDFGVVEERPALVLEYVAGLTLLELEARSVAVGAPLPQGLALYIVCEVSRALDYVHGAQDIEGRPLGIIHRDVNPGNILVSTAGVVRLTDFGIAMAHERVAMTKVGLTKGTLGFMAPEQRKGETVDHRVDIFALGCVLHHLLTGKSPVVFEAEAVQIDPELAEPARGIVERATSLRRAERYGSAGELASVAFRTMTRLLEEDAQILLKAHVTKLSGGAPKRENPRLAAMHEMLGGAPPPRPKTMALDEDAAEVGADAESSPIEDTVSGGVTEVSERAFGGTSTLETVVPDATVRAGEVGGDGEAPIEEIETAPDFPDPTSSETRVVEPTVTDIAPAQHRRQARERRRSPRGAVVTAVVGVALIAIFAFRPRPEPPVLETAPAPAPKPRVVAEQKPVAKTPAERAPPANDPPTHAPAKPPAKATRKKPAREPRPRGERKHHARAAPAAPTKKKERPSPESLHAAVVTETGRMGLDLTELSRVPGLEIALRDYEAARANGTPDKLETAQYALLVRLARATIPVELLKARLSNVLTTMKRQKNARSKEELKAFEAEYFEIREALSQRPEGKASQRLARRITSLERRLNR